MTEAPAKKRGRPPGTGGKYTRGDPDEQIDLLIERRSDTNGEAEQDRLETWRNSVRAYHERREEEHLRAWIAHHRHMRELHGQLAAEHQEKARRLERRTA
jgi:hypothetical protein